MKTYTNYRIRGFTSANPDFTIITNVETGSLVGDALRIEILGHIDHSTLWAEELNSNDIDWRWELSLDQERSDLRDNESQRVWVFDSIYCNQNEDLYDMDHDCNDGQCERDSYMITVDIEGE